MNPQDLRTPLLQVQGLGKSYRLPRRHLWRPTPDFVALQDINFELVAGRNLGIVGESGSGKSTLARLLMALTPPSAGQVLFNGQDLNALPAAELRAQRRHFQMVFQDPYGSLDPRMTVGRSVAEPLAAHSAPQPEQHARVAEVLEQVGLRAADAQRYPHEFSGGQRQRIAIARALITKPQLIVADEPVSALDVSVQAQVLNLMQALQHSHGISYVLISHDLAVVNHLCDDVLVLNQGRIVERGTPRQLLTHAQQPYTRRLMEAVPHIAPGAARARRAAQQHLR